MESTLPLILSLDAVPPEEQDAWWREHRSVAVVHLSADGRLTVGTKSPATLWDKLLGRGGTRYAVDVSDHRRRAEMRNTPLPCSDQAHRFEATVDIGFRVHDPEEVVRRNVADALPVVYGHVTQTVRSHARRFAIDEADRAEEYINQVFAQEIRLPEGITVFHCAVTLEPDAAARKYIETLAGLDRELTVGRGRHEAAVAEERSRQAIADMKQEGELGREKQRAAALSGMALNIEGLIRQHLVQHPEDTVRATQLLTDWETAQVARAELGTQRHDAMFRFLVEKDILRSPDLLMLREGLLGGLNPAAPPVGLPPAAASAVGGGAAAAAPVSWGGTVAAGAAPGGGPDAVTGAAVPVYLVLDASQSAAPFADGLNDALRSLHTALSTSPDVAAGLRVCVLAFAENGDLRLPLTRFTWATNVPYLATGGDSRFGAAFEKLLDLLPGDVDLLKRGGGSVHRPVVFFVATAPPRDGTQWPDVRQQLAAHRYAPTVLACGLGESEGRAMLRIASDPNLAFVAAPGSHPADQARALSALLQSTLLHLGRTVLAGHPDLVAECPQGLVPADQR
ncbi:hypothetical protein [Actinacidiphila acididurans]|uniref:VWFA domain-containing protein n=1 Tax=Actinacidiphila acididurans TaxID=2784346 RepID=A0ABS2U223_9ACTN|nr:hypothetical protein [Actinacidiphila acididurans]MBM9509640.1 hypothetical protein [Actinacidiphila acididurans]